MISFQFVCSVRRGGLAPFATLTMCLAALLAGCDSPLDFVRDVIIGEDRFGADPGKPVYQPSGFVNWESPHVSPLDVSPDGTLLFAVNTADNRLEIFDLTGGTPVSVGSVAVGLDPVAVRARTDNEVWVANHVSDSISIVDIAARNVVRTLWPGDEPTDIGFANNRAFVVCSQLNQVKVYDLDALDAGPRTIEIAGEDPRALAVSPDGASVYVAIFESGNGTTIIPEHVVSGADSPYGGVNPIPMFDDPLADLAAQLPTPKPHAVIVKRNFENGTWEDDNGVDWSAFVTWDLHHHDLAIIDAASLDVSYVPSLMNLNMHLAVRPDGVVTVVGTEATNDIRFEPNLTGKFVRSTIAMVDAHAVDQAGTLDLNPHLAEAYAAGTSTLPTAERDASIADPRGVIWSADGRVGYVAGMGSNNVIKIDADGSRLGQLDVGQGPTGLRLSSDGDQLYVLCKFDASICVIDTATFSVTSRVAMFDPTPAAIRAGRPFLYDARLTSGLGVTSCGSCHVDGRMDQLSWNLGDPGGAVKPFNQNCDDLASGPFSIDCGDFHPLKGPMMTQTMQGMIGNEPLHWRGDREDLAAFNPAFVGLNGNDRQLMAGEMARMQAFLATVRFPPNPNRNIDNSLSEKLGDGNPRLGREIFVSDEIDGLGLLEFGILTCNRCHQLPIGTSLAITPGLRLNTPQSAKVPQLRNMHEKTGFFSDSLTNNRGFGFTHSGEFATVDDFLHFDVFKFGEGEANDQRRTDVVAFVMSMSVDTHAGVGVQVTLDGSNNDAADVVELLDLMMRLADDGDVDVVVRGRQAGAARGYVYLGDGMFQADRAGERISAEDLRTAAGAGGELTWTIVPLGSGHRIGIDRDDDGVFDADE